MAKRDWLHGGLAAAAAAALALPAVVRADDRRFTSDPLLDPSRPEHIIYAPILMARRGLPGESDVPGIAASWVQVKFGNEDLTPDTGSDRYRLREITVKRDLDNPTAHPEVAVVIEEDGELSEDAPPPSIVLIDSRTRLEVREVAEVFRDKGRTLYRAEVAPPGAALVPEGHRFYLNPDDHYEVQLVTGARELVAGMRQTLPTFGGEDPRFRSTRRRRR